MPVKQQDNFLSIVVVHFFHHVHQLVFIWNWRRKLADNYNYFADH